MKRLNWILSTPRTLVFAGLLVLALAALLWAAVQKYQSAAVQAAEVTADWPVYENLDHGFRIKYPPQWTFTIIGPVHPEVPHEMIFCDSAVMNPCVGGELPFIGLQVLKNPQLLSMEAWVQQHLSTSPDWAERPDELGLMFESYEITRTLNIAGVRAVRLVAVAPPYEIRVRMILIPHQDKIIELFYFIDPPSVEPFFELMALTVEFIP